MSGSEVGAGSAMTPPTIPWAAEQCDSCACSSNDRQQVVDKCAEFEGVFLGIFVDNPMVCRIPKREDDPATNMADAFMGLWIIGQLHDAIFKFRIQGFVDKTYTFKVTQARLSSDSVFEYKRRLIHNSIEVA